MPTFGLRLRATLLCSGEASPKRLATMAAISEKRAREWLKMERANVNAETMCRFAQRTGVRSVWLATGEGRMTAIQHATDAERRALQIASRMEGKALENWLRAGERKTPCANA